MNELIKVSTNEKNEQLVSYKDEKVIVFDYENSYYFNLSKDILERKDGVKKLISILHSSDNISDADFWTIYNIVEKCQLESIYYITVNGGNQNSIIQTSESVFFEGRWYLKLNWMQICNLSKSWAFFGTQYLPIKVNEYYYIDKSLLTMLINSDEDIAKKHNTPNTNAIVKSRFKTYVMFDSKANLYKIGRSYNPYKREKDISCGNPSIQLILICDNDIERKMHKEFNSKRITGEWFRLNADDILILMEEYEFKKPDYN